jgi:squalene synthase HpnC
MSVPTPIIELKEAEPEAVPLHEAYAHCEAIVRANEENFPVASRFLAPERRLALYAIYALARTADDVADADAPSEERTAGLDRIEAALIEALEGRPRGPILTALADAVDRFGLPAEPFFDLLAAFRDDATNATYATWDDLLGYCRGSANTIGRLMLALHDVEDPEAERASDALCTALQLTNMWQDLGRDLERGRLFIPLEDLRLFGLDRESLTKPASRADLTRILLHECAGTDELYDQGRPVVAFVPLALGIQLRATILGGRAVLRAVAQRGWRVLRERPRLSGWTRARVVAMALLGFDR